MSKCQWPPAPRPQKFKHIVQQYHIMLSHILVYMLHNLLWVLAFPVQCINIPENRGHSQAFFQVVIPYSIGGLIYSGVWPVMFLISSFVLRMALQASSVVPFVSIHMAVAMGSNQMPVFRHLFYQLLISRDILPYQKKGGFHSPLPESLQQPFRIDSMRPVVKRKRQQIFLHHRIFSSFPDFLPSISVFRFSFGPILPDRQNPAHPVRQTPPGGIHVPAAALYS